MIFRKHKIFLCLLLLAIIFVITLLPLGILKQGFYHYAAL